MTQLLQVLFAVARGGRLAEITASRGLRLKQRCASSECRVDLQALLAAFARDRFCGLTFLIIY